MRRQLGRRAGQAEHGSESQRAERDTDGDQKTLKNLDEICRHRRSR